MPLAVASLRSVGMGVDFGCPRKGATSLEGRMRRVHGVATQLKGCRAATEAQPRPQPKREVLRSKTGAEGGMF